MTGPPMPPPRTALFQRKGSGSAAGAPGGEQPTGVDPELAEGGEPVECQSCGALIDGMTGEVVSPPPDGDQQALDLSALSGAPEGGPPAAMGV